MTSQTKTRQSIGKNLADFAAGATIGTIMLPVELFRGAADITDEVLPVYIPAITPEDQERVRKEEEAGRIHPQDGESAAFQAGYATTICGILLLGGGYLLYKIATSGSPEGAPF